MPDLVGKCVKYKKEGEECGTCQAPPPGQSDCGTCLAGFKCAKEEGDFVLPDAIGHCTKEIPKKIGEDCGDCFAPPSYNCGTCEEGLKCKKNKILPDAPGTCVEKSGTINQKYWLTR